MTLSLMETPNDESGEAIPNNRAVAVVAEIEEGQPTVAAVEVAAYLDPSLDENDGIPLAPTEMIPVSLDEAAPENLVDAEHRPAFISATVLKRAQKTADVGLLFDREDDGLRIIRVDPEGIFRGSPICEGDFVLSVNNTSCENKSAAHVSRVIRRTKEAVTLVVRRTEGDPYIVSTMVTKPTPESRVGIGIRVVDGSLCVSSIDPSGLFAGGILNVGDKVVSIGGVPCPHMDSSSAIHLIRKEKRTITIVTWTEEEAGVVVAATSQSFGGSLVSLFWLWRKSIMIVSMTFILIAIIAIIVSQTGQKTACEDRGQRPFPVAVECP